MFKLKDLCIKIQIQRYLIVVEWRRRKYY